MLSAGPRSPGWWRVSAAITRPAPPPFGEGSKLETRGGPEVPGSPTLRGTRGLPGAHCPTVCPALDC